MNTIKVNLLFILLFMSMTTAVAGGGWLQDKGSGYLKVGQSFLLAGQYFQPDGSIVDITTIGLYSSSIYFEYGLAERFTGILYFPFFVRSTLNEIEFTSGRMTEPGDAVNALGDADVSIKYGIIPSGPIVLSATLTLGLPLGVTDGGDTRILQTGDGEFNQMISIAASHSFSSPLYATALLGFNNRTNDYSDEFRYGLEVGYSWGSHLITQLRMYGVESLMNGDALGGQGNSIFANDTEYLAITPEIAYNIGSGIGFSVSAGFAAYGKKILAAPNYMMGANLSF